MQPNTVPLRLVTTPLAFECKPVQHRIIIPRPIGTSPLNPDGRAFFVGLVVGRMAPAGRDVGQRPRIADRIRGRHRAQRVSYRTRQPTP